MEERNEPYEDIMSSSRNHHHVNHHNLLDSSSSGRDIPSRNSSLSSVEDHASPIYPRPLLQFH